MPNWNLSVDMRGQGDDLARALRESAREARGLATQARAAQTQVTGLGTASGTAAGRLLRMSRQAHQAAQNLRDLAAAATLAEQRLRGLDRDITIRARLDVNTTAGIAAARAALAGLNNQNLNLRIDVDNATAATAALAAVQAQADDTSRALLRLAARARTTANALSDLADRARAAALSITVLGAATRTTSDNITRLSGDVRTLRSDLDDLNGTLTTVNGNLGDLNSTTTTASSGSSKLLKVIAVLAPALIPIAASLAPIALGFAAAGAAATAFGIAIGGQIHALTEAGDAQEKYEEAVREHGKGSEQAVTAEKEYLRQLQDMPPATREAAAAVSVLKDEYKAWSDELAADTMPVAIKGMGLLQATLPKTTGLVRGTSAEYEHMLNVMAGAIQTPGFDALMKKLTVFTTETLAKATSGAVTFATTMDTGEIGADWREFMDYARENAPLVGDSLTALARAGMHLLVAFSQVGVGVLEVVNLLAEGFADLLNAIPPGALAAFLQVAAVMKLVTLSAAALGAATGGAAAARLAAYFAVMRAAGVATTLRATAASMSGTAKAAIGLGVLAGAAIGIGMLAEKARGAPPDVDRLTTSLKELAQTGKFTGELKDTFGDINGVVEKLGELGKAAKEQEEYVESFGNSGITVLDDLRAGAHDLWTDFTEGEKSLTALEEDFEGLDAAMAGLVSAGYGDKAATDFELIRNAALKAGYSIDEINAVLPKYNAAVAAAKVEQQLAAEGMGLFGQQALDVKGKLDAQKASADGLRGAIQALNDINRQALGGMIGFEASIDAAAKAAKDNAGALDMVNGRLDVNSPKAQAAATALQDLAAKTDEATAAARASGAPWGEVNAIYERGRAKLVQYAQQMGLTQAEANVLADSILTIPSRKEISIDMMREDALAGLDQVIAKIRETPGNKSVTVDALTAEAMRLLESVGFRTERLPDGRVTVTAITGSAVSNIGAVQNARDRLSDRTITITTNYVVTGNTARRPGAFGSQLANADGSVTDYYANGGIRAPKVRHFADGAESHVAQIAPAGSWRVWAEPETGGEAYVPLAASKRPRSRAIVEETVRRLGGDPEAIQWNAQGSVTGLRYDPGTGSLYSPSEVGQAGQKRKRVGREYVEYFDPAAVERKLRSASAATRAWNRDLERIADRVGGDVAEALASMGEDGVVLTRKMARGSTKYLNQMAAALRGLAVTARASLADYTRAMGKATATDAKFAANLATLAGRGYGDLAGQLAAQGDQAAMELAAAALGDNRRAAAANTAARRANTALTSEQVQQLVAIIAAVRTSKTGLHDVADATGLGEDDIVTIATKARGQISTSLGSRATKFLADLARAQKGLSYADGGIRTGIYSTTAGAVTFAEPQTGGEAFIPLGANKRRQATNVLRDVAGRFGIGLTDVSASRQVVVIKDGNTYITVPAVRTGASASDIGAQVSRSYRRARRGGVSARA